GDGSVGSFCFGIGLFLSVFVVEAALGDDDAIVVVGAAGASVALGAAVAGDCVVEPIAGVELVVVVVSGRFESTRAPTSGRATSSATMAIAHAHVTRRDRVPTLAFVALGPMNDGAVPTSSTCGVTFDVLADDALSMRATHACRSASVFAADACTQSPIFVAGSRPIVSSSLPAISR